MKTVLVSTLLALLCWGCERTEIKRPAKVSPSNPVIILPSDTATRHIYITFDDGPLEGSQDIDDAVRKEKINVNVFVIGEHALSNDQMKNFYNLYRKNPYIEIGNHSYTHAHEQYKRFYENPFAGVKDFMRCQSALQIPTNLVRLPGRNQWRLNNLTRNDIQNGASCADLLYKMGYKVFGWDVEWQHDPKSGNPLQSVNQMVAIIDREFKENKTVKHNNLVLLAHDEMFRNGWEESELKQLIDTLKARGNYRFDHLSAYPDR